MILGYGLGSFSKFDQTDRRLYPHIIVEIVFEFGFIGHINISILISNSSLQIFFTNSLVALTLLINVYKLSLLVDLRLRPCLASYIKFSL